MHALNIGLAHPSLLAARPRNSREADLRRRVVLPAPDLNISPSPRLRGRICRELDRYS